MSACSGDVFDHAYMASGDGFFESELVSDAQFSTTDDLNVVIKLNKHGGDALQVTARFYDTNNDLVGEVSSEADQKTETVILGLDFQGRGDPSSQWLRGRYRVDIYLAGDSVETLYFRVD